MKLDQVNCFIGLVLVFLTQILLMFATGEEIVLSQILAPLVNLVGRGILVQIFVVMALKARIHLLFATERANALLLTTALVLKDILEHFVILGGVEMF